MILVKINDTEYPTGWNMKDEVYLRHPKSFGMVPLPNHDITFRYYGDKEWKTLGRDEFILLALEYHELAWGKWLKGVQSGDIFSK